MPLAFAGHVRIVPVEGRGLAAVGETDCDVFGGSQFVQLAALVDGSRDEQEILDLCSEAEREELRRAIAALRRAGLLIDRTASTAPVAAAAWWTGQGVNPDVAASRIQDRPVAVHALPGIDPASAASALRAAGLRLDPDADLKVVLVRSYLDNGLTEINAAALDQGTPWMLAQPWGAEILIGPMFTPDRGPCRECLAQRLRDHRRIMSQLVSSSRAGDPGNVIPIASLEALGPSLIATELARWLAGASPGLESQVLSFDLRHWQTGRHNVVWRPQCPACGESDASLDRGAAPIKLVRRPDSSHSGEPLRRAAPEATLRRFGHHVSAVTGAIRSLNRHPGPPYLHVYSAGGPAARLHGDPEGWLDLIGIAASGKGTTDEQARAGALCEALERYSGRFTGDEPRRRGRFEDLRDVAIDPNDCMGFSSTQYAERERWNREARSFRTHVPEAFDPAEPIDWTPVWSLTQERERLVPTALCYYGADVPGRAACVADSNGNAAGTSLGEAILHGLLELIERDHVGLWWYNALPAPRVDLDSIDDPWLLKLRRHLQEQQRALSALDLTADLGIPVAVAIVTSPDGGHATMGYGAGVDLAGAVIRASTEVVQLGLGGASGGLGALAASRQLKLAQHPFLTDSTMGTIACRPADSFRGDVDDALERCRRAIEARGIEILVLDQTRPDIALPVVKVLAPGMRHFWPRFAPGRLYQVPVTLGRLARPNEEHELNALLPML